MDPIQICIVTLLFSYPITYHFSRFIMHISQPDTSLRGNEIR